MIDQIEKMIADLPVADFMTLTKRWNMNRGDILLFAEYLSELDRVATVTRIPNYVDYRKIQAIKIVRDLLGPNRIGLLEAKNFVEGTDTLDLSRFNRDDVRILISDIRSTGYQITY